MTDSRPSPTLSLSTRVAGLSVLDATYPGGHRYPFHCDGQPRISIVLGGTLLEEARGQKVVASAASVVAKPADVCHRNTFGPHGARLLSVIAPTPLVDEFDSRVLDRWRWHHAGPVGAAAVRFVRAIREAPGDIEDDLWSLLDAVTASDSGDSVSPPSWLLQVKERLENEFAAGPSVASLAAHAGVHPVALARAFRRSLGCSPTAYRRRLRVRAATNLLASGHLPAVEVALEAGFADQSHMCRDIRTELKTSPSRLRALLAI